MSKKANTLSNDPDPRTIAIVSLTGLPSFLLYGEFVVSPEWPHYDQHVIDYLQYRFDTIAREIRTDYLIYGTCTGEYEIFYDQHVRDRDNYLSHYKRLEKKIPATKKFYISEKDKFNRRRK